MEKYNYLKCENCGGSISKINKSGVCKRCQDSLELPCIMTGKGILLDNINSKYLVLKKSNSSVLIIPLFTTEEIKDHEIFHCKISELFVDFKKCDTKILYRDTVDMITLPSPLDFKKRISLNS